MSAHCLRLTSKKLTLLFVSWSYMEIVYWSLRRLWVRSSLGIVWACSAEYTSHQSFGRAVCLYAAIVVVSVVHVGRASFRVLCGFRLGRLLAPLRLPFGLGALSTPPLLALYFLVLVAELIIELSSSTALCLIHSLSSYLYSLYIY